MFTLKSKIIKILLSTIFLCSYSSFSAEKEDHFNRDSIQIFNISSFDIAVDIGKKASGFRGLFYNFNDGESLLGKIDYDNPNIKGYSKIDAIDTENGNNHTKILNTELNEDKIVRAEIRYRSDKKGQSKPNFFDYTRNETYLWHFVAYGAELFITPALGKLLIKKYPHITEFLDNRVENLGQIITAVETYIQFENDQTELEKLNDKYENELRFLKDRKASLEKSTKKNEKLIDLTEQESLRVEAQLEAGKLEYQNKSLENNYKESVINFLHLIAGSFATDHVLNKAITYFVQKINNKYVGPGLLKYIASVLKSGLDENNFAVSTSIIIASAHMYYIASNAGANDWVKTFGADDLTAKILVMTGSVIVTTGSAWYGVPAVYSAAAAHPIIAAAMAKAGATMVAIKYYRDYKGKYGDIQHITLERIRRDENNAIVRAIFVKDAINEDGLPKTILMFEDAPDHLSTTFDANELDDIQADFDVEVQQ